MLCLCFAVEPWAAFGQEPWSYGHLKTLKKDRLLTVYLDTLTLDSLIVNADIWQTTIKTKENIEISKGSMVGGMGSECGCEPEPHGLWIKRYRNGNFKEIGEYFCNTKKGTWTYFHENGNLMKTETYALPYLEFITTHEQPWDTLKNTYLLQGLYAEYYPNGQLKVEGKYEIIEAYSETDTVITFDPDTYVEIKTPNKGSFWLPKSVKTGVWKWVDENGKLSKIERFDPLWYEDKRFRPIANRYFELFFEEKK